MSILCSECNKLVLRADAFHQYNRSFCQTCHKQFRAKMLKEIQQKESAAAKKKQPQLYASYSSGGGVC